jgi:hypothetical protein
MITLIAFLIMVVTLVVLCVRINNSLQKEENKFARYFFWGLILSGIGLAAELILTALYLYIGQDALLFWTDVFGRLFIFLSTAALIQMPLYLYYPNSKKRIWVSYVIVAFGTILFFYNMTLNYQPIIDVNGIINWNSPFTLNILFGLPLGILMPFICAVFFIDFVKSKFKAIKSLFFGLGFSLGIGASIIQDYAKTPFQYILVNVVLAFSFVMVFIGFSVEKKSTLETS